MDLLPIVLALLAGFCTAVEHTINGRLSSQITPGAATLFNLAVGTVLMLLVNILRGNMVQYKNIAQVNPVLLTGGIFGAMIVYLSSKTVPIMGVTKTLVLIVAGQLAVGILSDVFLNNLRFDITKCAGIVIVVFGAYLIVK